jgi:Domain of unknown function (DUF5671)
MIWKELEQEMVIGWIVESAALLILFLVVIRKVSRLQSREQTPVHVLRNFFQYSFLMALLFIGAVGISGLLGRVFTPGTTGHSGQIDLARNLSFAVVGVPLFVLLLNWTQKRHREDEDEKLSFGFRAYMTLAPTSTLIILTVSLYRMFSWMCGVSPLDRNDLSKLIVWGSIWFFHWRINKVSGEVHRFGMHEFLGSLIGLTLTFIGSVQLTSSVLQWVFGFNSHPGIYSDEVFSRSLALLLVGASIWTIYWWLHGQHSVRNLRWHILVLIVGVGISLFISVVGMSNLVYKILVWFIGETTEHTGWIFFRESPVWLALASVGLISSWYHRRLLAQHFDPVRNEVERFYEYLVSGLGLLSGFCGITIGLVALIEHITFSKRFLEIEQINTFLAAITLIAIGLPIWIYFWRGLFKAKLRNPRAEINSQVRRGYLFLLFGLGGIVAVLSLIAILYFFFEASISGHLGLDTLERMRFVLALLLSTVIIAEYHWRIYKSERELFPHERHQASYILLVGIEDDSLKQEIVDRFGGKVEMWNRLDSVQESWPHDKVLEMIASSRFKQLLIYSDDVEIKSIPIRTNM